MQWVLSPANQLSLNHKGPSEKFEGPLSLTEYVVADSHAATPIVQTPSKSGEMNTKRHESKLATLLS